MAISIKLKRRWDEYPTLQDVLAATQNLSVSPFGLTEEGLQDFRGIKPIGKIEEVSTPARGGTRRITKTENIHTSLSYADFSGLPWQDFGAKRNR